MANVGVCGCDSTDRLQTDCASLSVTFDQYPNPDIYPPGSIGPKRLCPDVYGLDAYHPDAGGVGMTYDPTNQIWQSDPAAGYPSLTLMCDGPYTNPDGTTTNLPLLIITGSDGSTHRCPLQTDTTDTNQNELRFITANPYGGADCTWRFTFKCVGGGGLRD